MAHWDTSELHELVVDLNAAPGRIDRGAKDEMQASATRLHKKMRKDASGHRFVTKLGGAMAKENIGPLHWEIGFNKGKVGSLGNIIAFGSINNAPVYMFYRPFRTEQIALERRLADVAEDAVLGGAE